MRLIDADLQIDVCKKIIAEEWNHRVAPLSWADAEEIFLDRLYEAPTVDAVEVVRCKECKNHEDEEPGMVYCPHVIGGWVNEMGFCADGERKEERK